MYVPIREMNTDGILDGNKTFSFFTCENGRWVTGSSFFPAWEGLFLLFWESGRGLWKGAHASLHQ